LGKHLNNIYERIGGEAGLRKYADKYGVDIKAYDEAASEHRPAIRNAILTEELLAHVAQQQPSLRGAIHAAAQQGWNEFIRFLAASGADLNLEDRQGNTALDIAMGKAATGRFASTVEPNPVTAGVLLELGAKPGSAQRNGSAQP
jgi:hypothetical protein